MDGRLDPSLFPCIENDTPPNAMGRQDAQSSSINDKSEGNKGPGKVYRFAKFQATWANKRLVGTNVGQEDWRMNGPRIIILVLGGLGYSEARIAYEISEKYKRQVFIGKPAC